MISKPLIVADVVRSALNQRTLRIMGLSAAWSAWRRTSASMIW
jgi:hypothetical protein